MNQLLWQVPKSVLNETAKAFASKKAEVFALWTAPITITDNICRISRCIIPAQESGVNFGAYVHIEGKELSRIAFDNYYKGERNVIQLHTHPSSNVSMSALDREWEVVNHVGALSIIVPNYCVVGLDNFPGVNVYERMVKDWRLMPRNEIKKRLIVI